MNNPLVTIILSTYNRPDTLKTAIYSVVNQTIAEWKLYVIGDCCDERTEKVISLIADDRIIYVNLPQRFGEQSGPNSIGLALVKTPYLAFLNHDDAWLDDHLESGLKVLVSGKYDFYLGGTAYSRFIEYRQNHYTLYVDEINTIDRGYYDFFTRKTTKYEPASSWILKSEAAISIGFWNSYTTLYRHPIEDYLLRAWRSSIRFYFAKKVTVWAIVTQYRNSQKAEFYNYKSLEHDKVEKLIEANSGDKLRGILVNKLHQWKTLTPLEKEKIYQNYSLVRKDLQSSSKFRSIRHRLIYNTFTAVFYKFSGIDIDTLILQLLNKEKGFRIKYIIKIRTGEIPVERDQESVIESFLEQYR